MNWAGLIMGLTFIVVTGLGHVVVIKGEYHFGAKIWPGFLLAGIVALVISFVVDSFIASGVWGIVSFTCFWSIHEIIKQKERVRKGWFPQKNA